MYQVNGTSALASYKPAFKIIEGGAKKGSVAPKLEEVSYVKTLTNSRFYCGLIVTASFTLMFWWFLFFCNCP